MKDQYEDHIHRYIIQGNEIRQKLTSYTSQILEVAKITLGCFLKHQKIMLCGNGGSAADCQHIAAEFVNKFQQNRGGLAALALTTDSSVITSIANDINYNTIFARQVQSLGVPGDLLFCLSTSGTSSNVIEAAKIANLKKIKVISFIGESESPLEKLSFRYFKIPTDVTSIIQECHIILGHLVCLVVDELIQRNDHEDDLWG